MTRSAKKSEPLEIALSGDMTNGEADLTDKILGVPFGGECTIYFDSPGGSPYCGLSLATLILLRKLRCTAYVTGECSSAALWPLAACVKRYVTPYSVLLFHPMKWQSEEHVGLREAAEWSRHFAKLEGDMDAMLCDLLQKSRETIMEWIRDGRYVTGAEMVEAGLAEMISLPTLTGTLRKLQAESKGLSVHKPSRTKRKAR
ncbi:MAG: ATP-dependent Clp protease proteolytic subunit [Pirellulales bacterium]